MNCIKDTNLFSGAVRRCDVVSTLKLKEEIRHFLSVKRTIHRQDKFSSETFAIMAQQLVLLTDLCTE